ncbi:MAG TPA: M1 family metallopeptidase [Gemmatimonadales bacterium]|jgi:aminopeptidase N
MRLRFFLRLGALLWVATPLAAQRQTGVVGAYTPPVTWPQEPLRFDLLHQVMRIRFDTPRRELLGEVTTLVAITLAPTDTIRLNAENMTIDRASDSRGRALRFSYDSSHVTVRLARPAAVGDTVEFTLSYHTIPQRGIYFVPRRRVIWSTGEAIETRAWIPTYDAPNDKTTWEFYVTIDSALSVVSNGRLVGSEPAAGGSQRVWHWSQETPASTYLYSVVVGPLVVLHDQWRGVPVDYWTYPDTVNAAWRSFGETPSMIELYSQLLGVPYAWPKYDQSIVPDVFFGGMENVSATTETDRTLVPVGTSPDSARGLVAHELAHQWFGDLTTTADWADIWLNEGLTTYMESVQEEKTRGWDAAEVEWLGHQQQALASDRSGARAVVWGRYRGNDPAQLQYSAHVYARAGQVAHQLRRVLGDSLFWAGMHRFLVDNAHQNVTTADYVIAMERTCRCDLDWFFDQWLYGFGFPMVRFTRHWDAPSRTLHVTVEQTQPVDSIHPLFRFPVTLRVITRDSVVRQEITVSKPSETFTVALPSEPLSFRFDEGGWLLGSVTGDQSTSELAPMAMHDLDIRGREWALEQLDPAHDSAAAAARRFVVLNEHVPQLRQLALRGMAHDSVDSSREVVRLGMRDESGAVRASALEALRLVDPAAALTAADAMYVQDPDNQVRQTALAVIAGARKSDALATLLAASGPDQIAGIRTTAIRFLGGIHDARAENALERLTATVEEQRLRSAALGALARTDSARAAALALRLIPDDDQRFAISAVQVVARVGGADSRAALAAMLPRETRLQVRAAIQEALARPH